MSLRSFSSLNGLLILPAFVLGASVSGAALAAGTSTSVQTYANQAIPAEVPESQAYSDAPLAPGTLTLQDVLAAHKTTASRKGAEKTSATSAAAPVLTPAGQSSSTGLMLSQGMKSVLQKTGTLTTPAVGAQAPTAPLSAAQMQSQLDLNAQATPAQAQGAPLALAPAAQVSGDSSGVTYQPGQAPKALGLPAGAESASTASTPAASGAACNPNVRTWEKTCEEAGYPAAYRGKVLGETRTSCADGSLQDVWVSNTCAPAAAEAAPAPKPAVDGACGAAHSVAVASAPSADLCEQGVASHVKGDGPWTWSCSGEGTGRSASCEAAVLPAPKPVVAEPAPEARPVPAEPPVAAAAVPVPVPASAPAVAEPGADRGELCGEASEILAYEAPEKDLCRVGFPSPVNGDGPWTWSCTSNEGVTSTCRTLSLKGDASVAEPAPAGEPGAPVAAPQGEVVVSTAAAAPSAPVSAPQPAPRLQAKAEPVLAPEPPAKAVEPACGFASGRSASMAPSSGLCEEGKASAVSGANPWRWTCSKGKAKVSCQTTQAVDGACGPANGAALASAPFGGLCASGRPSGIRGEGPWTWSCGGSGGGVDVSCAASVAPREDKVEGVCGVADGANLKERPVKDLCRSGTPSAVSGESSWTWSCSGVNGGAVGSCSATKIIPPKPPGALVNGLCGAANGVTAAATPAEGLCAAGGASGVVGNGPWNWSCVGENGGMTVSCTAPLEPPAPIDGACGSANGVATLVKPKSGLCSGGITGSVNGKGPWTWTCSGANGGNPASCVAPVSGKSVATPSVMTPAGDQGLYEALVADSPAPSASSGLVTPRLPSAEKLPSLDKKVLPRLTSAKPVASFLPTPSRVPEAVEVTRDVAPLAVPKLSEGVDPVPPPALRDTLPTSPALQDASSTRPARIPGNHLVLDPTISTILFTPGSPNIDEGVLSTLNKLSNVLQSNPDVRVSLIAYADNEESTPRDARRLSLKRALAVREYLASRKVDESRVDVHAEGANTSTGYMDRVDVKVND